MTVLNRLRHLSLIKQNTIFSASLVLAITFVFSAILGFLRSRFLYSHFYSCCALELDAYTAAFRLPDLIFKLLVTGALSASFIPVFSSYLHKDKKQADLIASTVITLLFFVFLIAAIIILIFTRPFSELIAQGFSPYQIDLMVNLTRILLIAQIFFLLSNFITAILQVHQVFIVSALSPIIYNFFIILSIFTLAPVFGIYGVVYGAVIGAFFHLAIQIPIVKKIGFNYTFSLKHRLEGVREVIRLMLPRSLSLGLSEIENTVTLFFASGLIAGSISLLNLAMQIMYLPSRIFATTVGQASLPILSKNVAQNKLENFKNIVVRTLMQSLFIALPVATIFLVNRLAIVRIAFGAKQFPWEATLITAKTLAFLSPAIVCQAIIQILVRSFYALHDTRTPMKISFVSLLINVATSFYLVNFTNLGIIGLAFSVSLANLVQCFGLIIFFGRKVNGINWSEILSQFNRILIASIIMGFVTWVTIKSLDIYLLDTARTINVINIFIISTVLGFVSYLISIKIFKVEQLQDYQKYYQKFKNRLSNSVNK